MLAVVAALAVGLWRRRTDGRLRAPADSAVLDAAALGAPLGSRATLVQFSADFCQPCRAARQVLADAAGAPGYEELSRLCAARLSSGLIAPHPADTGTG